MRAQEAEEEGADKPKIRVRTSGYVLCVKLTRAVGGIGICLPACLSCHGTRTGLGRRAVPTPLDEVPPGEFGGGRENGKICWGGKRGGVEMYVKKEPDDVKLGGSRSSAKLMRLSSLCPRLLARGQEGGGLR